jgi:uncharacterized DUF497 family protein
MRYVWDSAKDAVNRRKHGLSLEAGVAAMKDPVRYFWIDDRYDYGEERVITLGRSGNVVLVVVSAEATQAEDDEESIRIISVRKAVEEETDWYYLGRS